MSDFPKCSTFVRSLYGWLNRPLLIIVHGRLHYSPSIDNVHGRPYYRPSKTSSIVYHILVQETFLVFLVMILDLVRSLGHGRSLWTNCRWTNFSISYQLPLRSKGRPGYRRNLKLIHMGLCEPRVVKSLVDLLCASRLPKEMPRVNFWVARVVSLTLFRRLHFPTMSPCVIRWMDGVTSVSPQRLVSFPEWVMSLRCPHFATCHALNGWRRFVVPTSRPYIYRCILSLAPHISHNFPSANSSKSHV